MLRRCQAETTWPRQGWASRGSLTLPRKTHQHPQAFQHARTIPAAQLSIHPADPQIMSHARQLSLQRRFVCGHETVGARTKAAPRECRPPGCPSTGMTGGGRADGPPCTSGPGPPVHDPKHAGQVSVPGAGHPGIAPDRIQHMALGPRRGPPLLPAGPFNASIRAGPGPSRLAPNRRPRTRLPKADVVAHRARMITTTSANEATSGPCW